MKRVLYKIVVILLVFLTLQNFLINSFDISYATSASDEPDPDSFIDDLLGTVIGIFTWIPKLLALGLARGLQNIVGLVAYSQGTVDDSGNIVDDKPSSYEITPFDIFFNKIAILDIDFFNFNVSNDVIKNIRSSIAVWYYVLRAIAAAILLVVLVYIGIRMALSTVAKEKALYNKMLIDWACSLALILLLHYIAIFAISANASLMKMLEGVAGSDTGTKMATVISDIRSDATWGFSMSSLAAAVVYCMFVAQTIALFISYFMRMLKLAFLLIIAPLITLTYSIDKIGDGKAQALGNWLKEFVYTILIQPFHCIIYLSFITMAFKIIESGSNNNIAGAVFAILCLKFTKEAEKIVRKIFGFKDDNAGTSLAAGMAMSAAALGSAKKIGKGTRGAINGAKNLGSKMADMSMASRAGALALFGSAVSRTDENNNPRSFADRKAEAREKLEDAKATKQQLKELKRDNRQRGIANGAKEDIKKAADEIMADSKGTLTKSQAMARARLKVAQENRKNAIDKNGGKKPEVKGVRGQIQKLGKKIDDTIGNTAVGKFAKKAGRFAVDAKDAVSQSETLHVLGRMATSAGVGLFAGSMAYGAGANATTAFTTGMAAQKGTTEFMKSSTRTIAREVGNGLKTLGATSKEDAREKMDDIMQMGNAEEFNARTARGFLDEIEKQLRDAGLSSNVVKRAKFNMQNVIDKSAKDNSGESMDSVLERAINSARGEMSADDAGKFNGKYTEIRAAVGDYGEYKHKESVFNNMKTATTVGVDPNVLAGVIERQYRSDESYFGQNSGTGNNNSSNNNQQEENQPSNPTNIPTGNNSENNGGTRDNDGAEGENNVPEDPSLRDKTNKELEEAKEEAEDTVRAYEEIIEQLKKQIEELEKDAEKSAETAEAIEKVNEGIASFESKLREYEVKLQQIMGEVERRNSNESPELEVEEETEEA